MLTAENIKTLKNRNISTNGDLTKERARSLLKGASREQKRQIDALAGLKRVTINRVYVTGRICAKIAVAIAQTLSVDPFYLTGEADQQGTCTDEVIKSFLADKGYGDAAAVTVAEAKPPRKARVKKEAPLTPSAPPLPDKPEEKEPEIEVECGAMTEEEAAQLLHSLFIQAKYSKAAQNRLEHLKSQLV